MKAGSTTLKSYLRFRAMATAKNSQSVHSEDATKQLIRSLPIFLNPGPMNSITDF